MTMTASHAQPSHLFAGLARVLGWLRAAPERPEPTDADRDASRARRDFVLDRLYDNSDAFAGEDDVRCMMACFPREF